MSDVQPEEIHPPADQVAEDPAADAEQRYAGPPPAESRAAILGEMTRDAEPYADKVDVFGPPRTEPPSPAEVHEAMQRVTGQVVDALTGQAEKLAAVARHGIEFHPHAYCGCTDTTKCRVHGFPSAAQWQASDIKPMELPTPTFYGEAADTLSKLMGDAMLRRVKADEQSLRAMGAKGDGRDMLFEMQPPLGLSDREVRLRVLARAEGLPQVAVEASVSQEAFLRWAPLAEELGKAMMDCAARMRQALAAWQAMYDATTGEPLKDGDSE